MATLLSDDEIKSRLLDVPSWNVRAGWLCRTYSTPGWSHTLLLVNQIAFIAEAATRFGRHATLFITSIIVAMALAGTRTQGGLSPAGALSYLNIWLFLVTLSTVGMALATVFNERRVALLGERRFVDDDQRHARRAEALSGEPVPEVVVDEVGPARRVQASGGRRHAGTGDDCEQEDEGVLAARANHA